MFGSLSFIHKMKPQGSIKLPDQVYECADRSGIKQFAQVKFRLCRRVLTSYSLFASLPCDFAVLVVSLSFLKKSNDHSIWWLCLDIRCSHTQKLTEEYAGSSLAYLFEQKLVI